MNRLLAAVTIGAIAGSRSMLAPALVARAAGSRLVLPLRLAAAGEMVADKMPFTPARTTALPLAGRVLSGATAGAAVAGKGRRIAGAVVGACGAFALAHLMFRARMACQARRVPDALAAVCEDAVVLTAGTLLSRGLGEGA